MKLLEILWSWPTIAAAVLLLYHREARTLLHRLARSSKAKFGSLEIEMTPLAGEGQAHLQRVHGQTFNCQRVELDGKLFKGCEFVQTTLVFSGMAPVELENCIFSDVRWEFSGPALLTLQFMTALYHGAGEGGSKLIERTFENMRKGKVGPAD